MASCPLTTGRVRYSGLVNPMSKSNEKYKSKKQMERHEKSESRREQAMEYKGLKDNGCCKRKGCK
jgi:hypothetical protein